MGGSYIQTDGTNSPHSSNKLTSRTRQLFNSKPLPLDGLGCNSAHMMLRIAQQDILRFDVGVNDFALGMQVMQTL